MIFLKPHWTAALAVTHSGHLNFHLGWIQGTINTDLLLQRFQTVRVIVDGSNVVNRVETFSDVGQLTSPVRQSILLGDKLAGWDQTKTPVVVLRGLASLLHNSLEALIQECADASYKLYADELVDRLQDLPNADDLALFNINRVQLGENCWAAMSADLDSLDKKPVVTESHDEIPF